MTTFTPTNSFISTHAQMDHNTRIAKAIEELDSQERINYAATAKKWDISRETLSKRYKRQTGSIQEANSQSRQKLTTAQEEALIRHINKLSDQGIPPTPQILKNIAEELAKTDLGVNWVARFRKRHEARLSSVYLRTIDHQRKMADNSRYFRDFFDSVSFEFLLFYSILRLV